MSTHLLRPLRLAQRLKAATASCIPSTNTTQPKHPISTNTSFTRAAAAAAKPSLRQWYQSLWRPRDATATLPPYDHVTQIGDPLLRRAADPVPVDACGSAEVRFLVDRLVHVMRAYKCVGLAAPQIGIALRVMVMEFNAAHMDSFAPDVQRAKRMALLPLTVLINPTLHVDNYERTTLTEACASVRGYAADVARYEAVTISGHSIDGVVQRLPLSGWNARIAQHEFDHLNGVLFTDVMDAKTLSCTCWQAVNAREGRVYIEFNAK